MSTYQEFVEKIERRQRRLARRQVWFRMRRELDRSRLFWTAIFATLLATILLLGIAANLGLVK